MRRVLLVLSNLVFFLAISFVSFAQTLENQVISIGGTSVVTPDGNHLDWTVGEAIIGTLEIQDRLVTQGFHQPYLIDCSFDIETKVTCIGNDEFVISVMSNSTEQVIVKPQEGEMTSFSGEFILGPFASEANFNGDVFLKQNPACSEKIQINDIDCKEQNFQLLSFEGKVNNSGNVLNWITFGELTDGKIVLQRSVDGETYTNIHQYASRKDNFSKSYNDDLKTDSGLAFYRLVALDKNGVEIASKDVTLARVSEVADVKYEIEMYPNPVVSDLFIYLKDYDQDEVIISLYSLVGSSVKTMKLPVVDRKVTINVRDLDIATYLISIVTKDGKLITTNKIQKFD